jgi:hypothetical protein
MKHISKINYYKSLFNKKPELPSFIKDHPVFENGEKIKKVFPAIGLSNFREETDDVSDQECTLHSARQLSTKLSSILYDAYYKMGSSKLARENPDAHFVYSRLVSETAYCFNSYSSIKQTDKSIEFRLPKTLSFKQGEEKAAFNKDQSGFKIYNELEEILKKFDITIQKLDTINEFKDFSKVNVADKKYQIVFSATGEDGFWDISTISMRGITSCQSWTAEQSKGLIGTLATKYAGVIYLTSGTKFGNLGDKMLYRAIVRFIVSNKTNKPAIMLDKMYPEDNHKIITSFINALQKRSQIEVKHYLKVSTSEYYIPDEKHLEILKDNEKPYMDYYIPIKKLSAGVKRVEYFEWNNFFNVCVSKLVKFNKEQYDLAKLDKEHKYVYCGPYRGATVNICSLCLKRDNWIGVRRIKDVLDQKIDKEARRLAVSDREHKAMMIRLSLSKWNDLITEALGASIELDKNYKTIQDNPMAYSKYFRIMAKKLRAMFVEELKNTIRERVKAGKK